MSDRDKFGNFRLEELALLAEPQPAPANDEVTHILWEVCQILDVKLGPGLAKWAPLIAAVRELRHQQPAPPRPIELSAEGGELAITIAREAVKHLFPAPLPPLEFGKEVSGSLMAKREAGAVLVAALFSPYLHKQLSAEQVRELAVEAAGLIFIPIGEPYGQREERAVAIIQRAIKNALLAAAPGDPGQNSA